MRIAGLIAPAPTSGRVSSVNAPSAVVSPARMPSSSSIAREQLVAAGEAAGGAVADGHDVAVGGQEAEPAETGGAEDLRPVDAHPVADDAQRALRQVAVPILDGAEDGDQRLGPAAEAVDQLARPKARRPPRPSAPGCASVAPAGPARRYAFASLRSS